MSYYQGDYYRGDYYRGDPGFFGSLFGGLKKVVGIAGGFMPGMGGIVGKLATKIPGGGAARGAIMRVGGTIAKHPVLTAAGAAGTIGLLGGAGGERLAMHPGAGMRGMHVSKKTGKLVRNRRMRVTNVRALRRAIRRCTGFAHLAKRVLRFTSPRPPRGRAVFKHARRSRKRLAA